MIEGLKIEKVSLSRDAAIGILETAFDAGTTYGIGYWADIKATKTTTLPGSDEQRIGAVCLLDREGGGVPDLSILGRNNALLPDGHSQGVGGQLWLTGDVIMRAVERMLQDPAGTDSAGWVEALLTYDGPDGPLADAIIQVACFGKVIYG